MTLERGPRRRASARVQAFAGESLASESAVRFSLRRRRRRAQYDLRSGGSAPLVATMEGAWAGSDPRCDEADEE